MDDANGPEISGHTLFERPEGDTDAPSTILVVDDSRVVRAYLRSRLEQEGLTVALAKDGAEAMDLLSDDIGVVLLDLWMPGMDGMTCLGHIREHFPDIPTIMITVSHEVANAVQAMKQGAFDYVTKPFDPDALLALVNQAMTARHQAHRLRIVESELRKAREHEEAIAARIQQTLLMRCHPLEFSEVKIGDLTVASKNIDGDFYDFFRLGEKCFDLIVGDVMGKGVPAALLGAAAKQHFTSVLYHLVTRPESKTPPSPEEIVQMVHGEMIAKMKELETFFTLCYARFDLAARVLSYVDCGHMRTIHFHSATGACSLLQGVNMPLGFPGQDRFNQIQAPFLHGDLFFFYSDGLTEARSPDGEFYGEARLVEFVKRHAVLEPQYLCRKAWKEISEFSRSNTVSDDFTCVAVKIEALDPATRRSWKMELRSDPDELDRVRIYLRDICCRLGPCTPDEERIRMIQDAAAEIMAAIIGRSPRERTGEPIVVEVTESEGELVLSLSYRGAPIADGQAPAPVSGREQESGAAPHAAGHHADDVKHTLDRNGLNCASIGFPLQRREIN